MAGAIGSPVVLSQTTAVSRWFVTPLRAPDVHGVVLDPAGLRIMLRELKLLQGNDLGAVIQQNGAGTRGPLIKSKNVFHVSGRSRSPGARTGVVFGF